jgi:hypothetical protein
LQGERRKVSKEKNEEFYVYVPFIIKSEFAAFRRNITIITD